MELCTLCKGKKSKRLCPTLNEGICPECCGTKRGTKIICQDTCDYYTQGRFRDNERAMQKLLGEPFNDERKDIFKNEEAIKIFAPFELFLFENYYDDVKIKDADVFQCLVKIYYELEGQDEVYQFNEFEATVFNKFVEIAIENEASLEFQKAILLRLMKFIKRLKADAIGLKNYFELLRGQFEGTGTMAGFF